MTPQEASPGHRLDHEQGGRTLGRRAAALTLTAAGVLGVAAGAVASRLPTPGGGALTAAQGGGSVASRLMTPAMPPTGGVNPSSVPTAIASPPTSRAIRSTSAPATTTPAEVPSNPPPLSETMLRLNDWRSAGLGSPVAAPVRRTASRCQDADLGSMAGVRSARYSAVTAGSLTGVEVVAETRTTEQADAVLRSVVRWRDTCSPNQPNQPNRAYLGTSDLAPISVDAPAVAYRWTFVLDPVTDDGNSRIEQVVLVREGNRVALAVVSREVPAGTSRTSRSPVDQTALGRLVAARLT